MARLALFAPLLALLGGCIIYDTKCPDCGWDDQPGRGPRGDSGDIVDDTGPGEELDVVFTLDPSTAAVGATVIASLTTADAFDFGAITDVEAYGDVTLTATDVREDEVLLAISVAGDAEPGTVDLLLHLAGGDVAFVPDALTIVPAGGGDGGGDGGGGDGGGGDGSGDGSDDCP